MLPAISMWWLDHYQGFARHLERYRRVDEDPATGVVFELEERAVSESEERKLA